MNIGLFTDTYFPQVSGVATSIKTLRDELRAQGHNVYIFTTTDPKVGPEDVEPGVYRFASVPFVSFSDRRIAVRGLFKAYKLCKELELDIIHTQTEFSLGWMGKVTARSLKIPCIHTYHTMYQDYLHYIANGRILKPRNVKQMVNVFMMNMTGIVAPSERVRTTLTGYGIKTPMRVIPTGVNLDRYGIEHNETQIKLMREQLGYTAETPVLLSLSRLAFEKNIHELIEALPDMLESEPKIQLLIVGDGPARETLEKQAAQLQLAGHVTFTGEINNNDVQKYYQLANVFVSASDSESQGLTYIEALASGLPIVVMKSPYTMELIDDPAIGVNFETKSQLVTSVLQYCGSNFTTEDNAKRNAKLDEISAQTFGTRVIQFYKDSEIEFAKSAREPINLFRGPRG
ncbi:glycosyltransferase [Paucilactobacillus oligofermentans DSM 15707 = LMG 22743]|uniref:Glycosyltransferase n=1 Tax=Paucilactobacillus oligofermentans DSM 15707 = LMG 22743 TaxID=1423778 RepID=A0A0R1RFE4_9LACO|nr:glycosyltransferase family 4 protein [Paucilactobacillus oligofermentans]KRL55086.1 glycosyltransferase [Paucilactobacillus oligofermentans DSM 15707 = LMG 22743]CUS25928.1 1,2-diacylglycerol 3-glucosyltransferase [Paucilactobacillus oligofermentans DSM 15707 = LMG 22743]